MRKNLSPTKAEISVVLPLYKPQRDWPQQLLQNKRRLEAFLPEVSFSYVVVHDGPVCVETEKVMQAMQEACTNLTFYTYSQNQGKGHALRYGVGRTTTPFVLTTDFDFPYELENIRQVVAGLKEGYAVVTGRRTRDYFSCLPLKRRIISRLLALGNRLFFTLPVNDTQSGLKGFNQAGKAVFLQTTVKRFLVDTEFLLRLSKSKLPVKVIDVHLRRGIVFSDFGTKVLKTEAQNFLSLLRLQRQLGNGSVKAEPLRPQGRTVVVKMADVKS